MARPHPHKRAARLAAFSILCVLVAVVAVWAAPRLSDAVAAWMHDPPVELRTAVLQDGLTVGPAASAAATASDTGRAAGTAVSAPTAGAVTVDAGMTFTMAGVTCTPPARDGAVQVLLRTSQDGQTWSRWYSVTLERAAEEGGPEKAFTEPIWTGVGRYVQVAAQRGGGAASAPALLRGVRVVAINSSEDADTAATVLGAVRRTAATIAGLHFTQTAAAMTSKPRIVTRSQWGANESWRSGSPDYAAVKMAFVHHTDSGNDYSAAEAPAIMRGVYAYHTKSLHWSDVGYNFLIDRYGVVYEGRYGGVSRGVIGAQVLGFNTGSTGISVIGTFTHANPTSASVTSLERLLEWKLDVHHVDPLGTATLRCAYGEKYSTGQRVTLPAISGHRDANYTDCPGNHLYTQLPNIRKVVARTGQPKIYGLMPDDPAISPNGDGVNDRVTIGFTVSQQATWTLEIRDDAGRLVRHVGGEGKVIETVWGGKDDDGKMLPDGAYSLQVDATSTAGTARPATATVRLDTNPPNMESADVTPDPFSPNGDGQYDAAQITYTPAEAVQARVSVVDGSGRVLRNLKSWTWVAASAQKVKWDGRILSGGKLVPAPEGSATVQVEIRDTAGNTTTVRRKVTVDLTLALAGVTHGTFSPNGDGVADGATLSFRLARAADVTATVIRGGSTVRTMRLGSLLKGKQSVIWDGKLGGGGTATSGRYTLKLTAEGTLGVTSAAQVVTVDLVAPRLTAPATLRAAYGKSAKISYTPRDAYSTMVKVGATVTNAAGTVVASLNLGWVKQGAAHVCAWRPRARGRYTVTFKALDLGGNRLAAPVVTAVKVR
jgi:flagellar hook assembly protein FlgD